MSKQLALASALSVLATVALALFGVDPVGHFSGSGQMRSVINVTAPALPALSQLLPNLQ